MDWAGLMRAGLGQLGLAPDVFWSLTPAELAVMLGVTPGAPAMSKARLEDLLREFPDRVDLEENKNVRQ